jgi:hypothetical protein
LRTGGGLCLAHCLEKPRRLGRQRGVGRHRRQLILPQIEILAGQSGEIGCVGHKAHYIGFRCTAASHVALQHF